MGGTIKKYVIGFLPALILIGLLLLPVLFLLGSWLAEGAAKGEGVRIGLDSWRVMATSLLISFMVAALATAAGTACGFLLYKMQVQGASFYRLLLLLPLLVAPYVFAVAWKDLLIQLLGGSLPLYPLLGMMMVQILIYFPLPMLVTGSALMNLNAPLEEAALLVAPFKNVVLKIILPLVRPALVTSFVLVFLFSLSDFSVPAFFGVRTFTVEIFTQFAAFFNYRAAIAQSLILVLVCLVLLTAESRYLSSAPFFSIGVRGSTFRQYAPGHKRFLIHTFLALWVGLAVGAPVGLLLYQSFSGNALYFSKAWHLLQPSFLQSLKLAAEGAGLLTVMGLVTGYLRERKNQGLANGVLLLMFVLPSTVLGIALIWFYNNSLTGFIYASPLIILLGYLGKFGFVVARILGNGFKQIPLSLEEAAQLMTGNALKRFWNITLPLLLPSLVVGFLLAFVLCLGELGTTIMVYPPGTELVPVTIFTISANAPLALTGSMTLISLAVTLLFIALLYAALVLLYKKYKYV